MNEERWRLVNSAYSTAAMNMALDEAIMSSVRAGQSPPTIRFYGWQAATISLGYFQSLEQELNLIRCQAEGVDVVRRLTGGRAVLHADELTYSLVAKEEISLLPKSVIESYRVISQGLLEGLRELGIVAELVSLREKKQKQGRSAACFDAPSWYELVVEDKKIIGSAQTRRAGVLLQHGSVLHSQDVELLFELLNFESESKREFAKRLFINQTTSIKEIRGQSFTFESLLEAFKKGMERGLGIELIAAQLSREELEFAQELAVDKYASREWNYKR